MKKYIIISLSLIAFSLVVAFGNLEAMVPHKNEQTFDKEDASTVTDNYIPTDCPNPSIKGEISIEGEKLYHTSLSYHYHKVTPVVLFCTVADAEASGYTEVIRQ